MPWLNAIFKKCMGTFFNEEIKKEQFTSMGLKNLTLKVQSFNQLLPPNMPFVIESGSIALLKLDLQKLTCFIEEVEITLTFKTLEQYKQFAQTYQKQQINAAKLQIIKDEILKTLSMKNVKSKNQNAWNILRSFLQKITFTINKLAIHVTNSNNKLSLAINQISMRVRKLQEEKDQMVSTAIIGGCSLHINETQSLFDVNNFQRDSCVFSLQQEYKDKYDQHVVIHLRTELKERLKFNSTLNIKLMQLCFNFDQFKQAAIMILSIIDHQKYIQSQDKVIIESVKQDCPQYQFTWCQSEVTTNYWDKIDAQPEPATPQQQEQESSDGVSIDLDDSLQEALEKSQFNEDEGNQCLESQIDDLNQSAICQSLNQSTLKQSIFSMSVFKEFINDDDDKQGLDDLNDATLIFKLQVQKIRIKLSKTMLPQKWNLEAIHQQDYYLMEIDQLNWLMTKELTSPTTIKQTKIEIPSIVMSHFKYETLIEEEDLFQSIHEDEDSIIRDSQNMVFHSCYNMSQNEVLQTVTQCKEEFQKQYGNNYYQQTYLLQIYGEKRQDTEILTQVKNNFIYGKVVPQGIGLQIKIDHLQNTQAITINKLDLTLDVEQILTFADLFKLDFQKKKIKSVANLNLVTIHHLNIDLAVQKPDLVDFYFINQIHNKEPNGSSATLTQQRLSFLTFYMTDLQIQQRSFSLITYDQLFCYKKEYLKSGFHSEVLAEIGAQKHGTQIRPLIQIDDVIRLAIPLVEFHLNLTYVEYIKSLIKMLNQLEQSLQKEKTQQESKKLKLVIDEIIIKINLEVTSSQLQTRFIIHGSKFGAQLNNGCQIQLYNCCIVDTAWHSKKQKADIPMYGSPKEFKNDQPQQILHFRHAKYCANQVILYKQERFNREGFKNLVINEAIKSDIGMGFQYTAIKLQMAKYLNPDCLDCVKSTSNMIEISIKDKIEIKYRHGIIQIDDSIEDTITTILETSKRWEQSLALKKSEDKPLPDFTFTIINLWLNYLPTYRKSTILKSYLAKKDAIKNLLAIQPEQLFYSWIRLLFRIKEATISKDLQAHLRSASVYVKSTSKDVKDANLSFLNPILLVPPQSGLYDVDRKFSDGYQIDKDEQGLLRLLCFQKLFKLKGITHSNRILNIGKVQGYLRKDSIIGLWDIAQMTIEKLQKKSKETESSLVVLNKQANLNIFEDDDLELPPMERQSGPLQMEIILKDLEIQIATGQHFPPELFSDPNALKIEFKDLNQDAYYIEHSNPLNLEEFPQFCCDSDHLLIKLQEMKLSCCGPSQQQINEFYLTVGIFLVVDRVQESKFSKLLGSEPTKFPQNFAELYYKIQQNNVIDVDVKVTPIRVCLSGPTLEFLLQVANSSEQVSPKMDLLSTLNVGNDKESIIEFCVQEGYQVSFQRPSDIKKPIQVNFLNIERIFIYVTFDGKGVKLDGKLKGLVSMASFDNLCIYLKRAQINNQQFEKEADLIKLLYEQYEHLIRNDKQLIGQIILSFKALDNILNIAKGVQTMFVTMYNQGLYAGVCSGSIPLMKALGNEIAYLAMKPIEVCGTVTEGIGLQVFAPIERMLDRFSTFTTSIPREFLKN